MPVVLKLWVGPEEKHVELSNLNESDFMKAATKHQYSDTHKTVIVQVKKVYSE